MGDNEDNKAKQFYEKSKQEFSKFFNRPGQHFKGEAHKLNAPSSTQNQPLASASQSPQQAGPRRDAATNEAAAKAAEERLRRLQNPPNKSKKLSSNTSNLGVSMPQASNSPHSPKATASSSANVSLEAQISQHILEAKQQGFEGSQASVVAQILANLAVNSQIEKYRKLRAGNKRITDCIVRFPAILSILTLLGCQNKLLKANDNAESSERFLVFSEQVNVDKVNTARQCMVQAFPEVSSIRADIVQQPKAEINRNIQVIIPSSSPSSPTVADESFYTLHAKEAKRLYQEAARQRAQNEVLMTKEMREKYRGAPSTSATQANATIRIRFPEQILLQAQFGRDEPVTRISQVVTEALRDPTMQYSLMQPRVGALPLQGTISSCGMVPAALLVLVPEGVVAEEHVDLPFLSDQYVSMAMNEGG